MSLSIPYLPPVSVDGDSLHMPIVFFDDFVDGWGFEQGDADNTGKFSETANLGQWLVTVIDGGTGNADAITCADDGVGGLLSIVNNAANDDAIEMQMNGEAWQLASGKDVVFEVRMKIDDVSLADWFVGLSITDTTVLGGVTDRIGFECPDATGDIDAISEKDSSQTTTDSSKDLADDTFVVLRFETSGTGTVRYYVNGALVAKHTTNIPEDEALTPTICIRNASGAARTMTLDYILVARDR